MNYAAESATGVSPTGLIIRLYETVVGDLGRAIIAIRDDDIERRSAELQHALAFIGQLQGSLDMEHGGEPAKVLDRFYDLARSRMIQAQLRHSGKLLEEVMRDFLLIRNAWTEVEKQTHATFGPQASGQPREDGSAWMA
jgi:flagellar secretion chaperone FliS